MFRRNRATMSTRSANRYRNAKQQPQKKQNGKIEFAREGRSSRYIFYRVKYQIQGSFKRRSEKNGHVSRSAEGQQLQTVDP